MNRATLTLFAGTLALAACAIPVENVGTGTPGTTQVYRIDRMDPAAVQFRMIDSMNALRRRQAAPAVKLNAQLNAAAETHSRDMLRQNRPWHFGSDGSSPIDRAQRAVRSQADLVRKGVVLEDGSGISYTFTELNAIKPAMVAEATRDARAAAEAAGLG